MGSKTPGLLAKRPSKRPEKDPKNRFTGPDFENHESIRGSRVLILRIRYSASFTDEGAYSRMPAGILGKLEHILQAFNFSNLAIGSIGFEFLVLIFSLESLELVHKD